MPLRGPDGRCSPGRRNFFLDGEVTMRQPVPDTRTSEPAIALRAVTRVYGSGGGAVTALREVTGDFAPGTFTRGDGAV